MKELDEEHIESKRKGMNTCNENGKDRENTHNERYRKEHIELKRQRNRQNTQND